MESGGEDAVTGFCKNGHAYTPENTYVPPKRPTVKICYTCKRAANRGWHKRRKKFLRELRNAARP